MPDRDLSAGNFTQPKYHPRYERSYAILIGIDSYQHPRLRPLGNAEADARSIQEILSTKPYNFHVDLLLGAQATRKAITRLLNQAIQVTEPNDRLIFYFAGHGYIQQDTRGFDVGYLACADTDPDDPFDGLEYAEVTSKLIRFAEAKHVAFILDACFSGKALGLTRSVVQPAALSEYLLHTSYQVLTAGGVEVVKDARSMTTELVKALKEGLPGNDSPFTFSHLGQHIHDLIHSQSQGRQSPIFGYLEGSSKGQMVLFTPSAADALPEELRLGLTDPNPLLRRFAIAEAERSLADPLLAGKVRRVLEELQVDDEDREVRRRAGEALRSVPKQARKPAKPAAKPASLESSEPAESRPEVRMQEPPKPASRDPILDILPPPFEWCDIPAGRVTLENKAGTFDVKPFKMAKYPITNAQFQGFIDANDGLKDKRWWVGLEERVMIPAESRWNIANHPRERVDWYAAIAFCRWLSKKVGGLISLPTEWEWQWAAQGPDRRQYPWGNEYLQGYANINEKGSMIKHGVFLGMTTPVDCYPQGASPYGVLDMIGNVWEWCLNEYAIPVNIDTSGKNFRVVRGGSWFDDLTHARCAYRYKFSSSFFRHGSLGFRVMQPLGES